MAPETMHGQALALGASCAGRAAGPGRAGRRGPVPQRLRCAAWAAPPPAAGWRRRCWPTSSSLPVEIPSASRLPGWVGPDTLVVVTSYSGETAEALDWFVEAGERRATRVASDRAGRSPRWPRRTACPSSPSRAAGSRAARSACCSRRCSCCSARPARRPTRPT